MLEDLPRGCGDADMMEKARSSVKAMLGNVTVVEDVEGVFAEVDLGRTYISVGAEERT